MDGEHVVETPQAFYSQHYPLLWMDKGGGGGGGKREGNEKWKENLLG